MKAILIFEAQSFINCACRSLKLKRTASTNFVVRMNSLGSVSIKTSLSATYVSSARSFVRLSGVSLHSKIYLYRTETTNLLFLVTSGIRSDGE
jgi:hypothetical protein